MGPDGEELGIEIFEEYFENGIPPHARDWLWNRFGMLSPEYGCDMLRSLSAREAQAYHDLSQEEKKSLHDKKLAELKELQIKSADRKDWTTILGTGLLANLHDYKGPNKYKLQFEKVIKQVIEDSSSMDDELSIDLKDEEDWA